MYYRLFESAELVWEALGRYNGALINECTTIRKIGVPLEDTMPML